MCKTARSSLIAMAFGALLALPLGASAVTFEDSFDDCNYPKMVDLLLMQRGPELAPLNQSTQAVWQAVSSDGGLTWDLADFPIVAPGQTAVGGERLVDLELRLLTHST